MKIVPIKEWFRKWRDFRGSIYYDDRKSWLTKKVKAFLLSLFRFILLVGVGYVIISPLIGIVARSFYSNADHYNPLVLVLPQEPTLIRYMTAIDHMQYYLTMPLTILYTAVLTFIQVMICSLVGYGFARFNFPLKKILFALVVVMIVMPLHTIALPLFITFREFDPLGIISLIFGKPANLMGTPIPILIMTICGCGLSSGIYIYIFNQFFRGLPKEIEEAALVDGAGTFYTYLRIMLVNAMPAVITVLVFSMVWQYNDKTYADLFSVPSIILISKRLVGMPANMLEVTDGAGEDPTLTLLSISAGVVLVLVPIIIAYVLLQKRFVEGVERSGIVG